MLEVRTVVSLNLWHVSVEDQVRLRDPEQWPLCGHVFEGAGVMLWLKEQGDPEMPATLASALKRLGFSDAFVRMHAEVAESGADLVIFDEDAAIVTGLPVYG